MESWRLGPSAPQNPRRASNGRPVLPSPAPYQPVAESGEKGWSSLWTGRLRHCPPGSRPHVIVTFDLAQKPIGRGLGDRARGARGKGLCPCRPLTKYRNSRGGGPRRQGWADACGEGDKEVSASIFTPSPPDSGHIPDGLRTDRVAQGSQPALAWRSDAPSPAARPLRRLGHVSLAAAHLLLRQSTWPEGPGLPWSGGLCESSARRLSGLSPA